MHWFHSDEVTWLDSRLGPWRNEFKFPIRSIIQISLISIELVIVTVSSVPQSNADYRFGEFKGAKFCVIFITVSQKILNSFNIWITNPPKISKPKTHIYIEIFWKKKNTFFQIHLDQWIYCIWNECRRYETSSPKTTWFNIMNMTK